MYINTENKKKKNDCAPSTDPISSVLIQIVAPAGEGWFMIISRSLEVFFDFSFFLFSFLFFISILFLPYHNTY